MPDRAAEAPSPPRELRPGRYRRPADELVARAARAAVRGGKASFGSLAAFREAVIESLRQDEPLAAVGGPRLRRLLVEVPGVKLTVHYTERPGRPIPELCPVCRSALAPIRNRTLTGETVVIGRECTRCAYWTHGASRIPVRYTVSRGAPRRRR